MRIEQSVLESMIIDIIAVYSTSYLSQIGIYNFLSEKDIDFSDCEVTAALVNLIEKDRIEIFDFSIRLIVQPTLKSKIVLQYRELDCDWF